MVWPFFWTMFCATLPLELRIMWVLFLTRLASSLVSQNQPCYPCLVLHVQHSSLRPLLDSTLDPTLSVSEYTPALFTSPFHPPPSNSTLHYYYYTRHELLSVKPSSLDPSVTSRLRTLYIGTNLPRKRGRSAGRRKQRTISIVRPTQQQARKVYQPFSCTSTRKSANHSNLINVPLHLQNLNTTSQLCLCAFNARSVSYKPAKRSAICDFIHENDVDVMLLTETWLRHTGDEAKIADLTPQGYSLFSFPRLHDYNIKRGGGLAFIVKDVLANNSTTTTDFPFPHSSFELGQLNFTIYQQRVSLFLVYRPPPSKKNRLSDSIFFNELPDFLEFCNFQNNVVILGDFNVHFDNASDVNTRKLCDQFNMMNLVQSVTEPTHVKGHILDLVVTKQLDSPIKSTRVCHDLKSDHFSVLCQLFIEKPRCPVKFKYVRSFSKIDHEKLSTDIAMSVTPNMPVSDMNNTLSAILDKHAPVCQRKVCERNSTPWYSAVASELRDLKRERRRAERRWCSSRLTVHREIYDYAIQKVVDLVHSAKTSFYSSLVSNSTNCKQLFHNMTSLLGKTKKVSLPTVSDVKLLPDMFANYFKNKIIAIRDSFPSAKPDVYSHSVAFSGTPLCVFSPVSQDTVRKLILTAAPKSCELDPIPTKFLQQHIDLLLPVITNIMNESIISGTVPSDFKTAVVKPLLKKSNLDPNELKNYRPISNLPFLSKLLERLILQQLFSHLSSYHLLSPHQSAYRAGHSTETVLLRILNDLLSSLDQNKISVLLLLDLSAAFDTIDHSILLSRLDHDFGIRDCALNWFHSYLSDRRQSVLVKGNKSFYSSLDFGVPQGSVLGPVLFILYTTPLTHLIDSHSVRHEIFADDTQLHNSGSSDNYHQIVQTLQDCVFDVKLWMSQNRLKLNDDKTEALQISPFAASSLQLPSSFPIGDTDISFSEHVRDLGFIFDNDLSMKQHIIKTCRAAYMEIRRISSIRHYLTLEATKTLVSTCVLSRLDYCNSLFSGYPQKHLKPLQQVQNAAAKLIFKARRSDHCTPLFKLLHWLPIEQRIKYKTSCLCFHVISGTAPAYLSELLHIYTPSRSLRSSSDSRIFHVPKFNREKHGARAFSSSAVQTWNSLPFTIRHSPSLSSFKKNLKTFLFRQYID